MIPTILDTARVLDWYDATTKSPASLFALELERDQYDDELYLTDAYIAEHGLLEELEVFALSERSGASRPFQVLMHLFAYVASFSDAWRNGLHGFDHFRNYLIDQGFNGAEDLFEILGPFSLVRYRAWLSDKIVEKDIAPSTADKILSKARTCFKAIPGLFGGEEFVFYDVEGFDKVRVTDLYRPYSLVERDRISNAVTGDIKLYNRLAQPYIKSGIGCDPFEPDQSKIIRGYATLDNMRWVFENHLNCTPPTVEELKVPGYAASFVKTINRLAGNVLPVYQAWGVLQHVDKNVITPYVIRLAQVTGLNADSLKYLELDDYAPYHPVTRRPCLRYWKERSNGQKLYHLDLVTADITWLTSAQSIEVAKIFEDVKYLTSRFRHEAPAEIANKLFIWKSLGPESYGEIKSLATSKVSIVARLFSEYSKLKGLLDDKGEPLGLSASRLRPSFISELIDNGVSPREIQVILGHAKLRTTVAYLDRMDFNRFARKKLDEAITALHQETVAEATLIPLADVTDLSDVPKKDKSERPQVIFKTPLADCANIFNPPDFVKKLPSYVPGTPCAMYNKCLACDNSIITVAHLPRLFAMNRDYTRLVEVSRVMDTPYGFVVKENMNLLKKILDPATSDFSEEELREAHRLSEYIETTILIDGVGV